MDENVEELKSKIESLSKQIAQYALKLEKRNEEVKLLGYYDPLTSLPNRAIFYETLKHRVALAKRNNNHVGILYLDLDYFKLFNNSHGHLYGDQLLVEFTQRLQKLVRESDVIAHMGGDEFCIMLNEVTDEKDCAVVARKINAMMYKTFDFDNNISVDMTVSIGISTYPSSADNAQALVRCANSAAYKAKERGRDNFQHYSEELDLEARKRLEMERDMKTALQKGGQFFLLYQPIYDVKSEKISGCEALIRWEHPVLGLVPPLDFIPIAEKSALILPIGEWVIAEACRQCAQWNSIGINHLNIAINISARQFRRNDLPEIIMKHVNQTAIDPQQLVLEITEGMLIDDVERCKDLLETLRSIGVQVSIDDFGTGYSSLTYLKNFPLNKLKIDKSFIDDITDSEKGQNLVHYTVDLGHNLGLTLVAEGVEDKKQVALLQDMHCDQIQGYFYSPPIKHDKLIEMVRAEQTDNTPDETPLFK